MTLTEFQTNLHALFRGDGNTPSDGDTKWDHRVTLLAAAINIWESQDTLWNELWATLAAAATGDKTVNSSDLLYTMPTDFRFLGSYVRTTDSAGKHSYFTIITQPDSELQKNSPSNSCFVTGNLSAGYVLNFTSQPTAGDTINYPYYKMASNPDAAAEVIEMLDPWFAVYYALGHLQQQAGAGDLAQVSFAIADQKLSNMKRMNMLLPHDQTNKVGDRDFRAGFSGFGSSGARGISRYGDTL